MRLSDLQESRHAKVIELRGLVEKSETEKRDLSEQERGRFESIKSEISGLDERITRAATVAELERMSAASPVNGERGVHTDLSRYSLARAIRSAGNPDGLEGEVHAELARGRECRGIMVPTEVLLGTAERRTGQEVGDSTKGGLLVPTTIMSVADRPRPNLKIESLGATVLRNLRGLVDLPNLASSGSTHWIGENQDTTRSDMEFAKVTLNPKTVSAEYKLTRQILNQANESIEALVRNDMGQLLAAAVDRAAIKSQSGGITEPEGLLNSGIELVANGSAFCDTVSDMIATLETDDVHGSGAFLTSPRVLNIARKQKSGDGNLIPLSTTFYNTRVEGSTQVPNNIGSGNNKSALIYGQWDKLVLGYWSGVDVVPSIYHPDVYSQGGMLIAAFLDTDVAVRLTEAFCYAEIA